MTEIENSLVTNGLNPRTDWDIDWDERFEVEETIAVAFEPFHGLWPAYCECYGVYGDYAVLKMPPSDDSASDCREPSNWLPIDEEHWCIVPEVYLRLQ